MDNEYEVLSSSELERMSALFLLQSNQWCPTYKVARNICKDDLLSEEDLNPHIVCCDPFDRDRRS
jgi:hypothetical protein